MIRTLTIKDRTGLFDIPSFILTETESLTIRFIFPGELRVGKYRVVVRHGRLKKTFTLEKTGAIDLPADWLNQNAENLEFSLVFLNATETAVVKDDYQIEPLKLETLDGNFKFSAMVQQLVDKQAEQAQKIEELLNKLKTFEDAGVPLPLNAE